MNVETVFVVLGAKEKWLLILSLVLFFLFLLPWA